MDRVLHEPQPFGEHHRVVGLEPQLGGHLVVRDDQVRTWLRRATDAGGGPTPAADSAGIGADRPGAGPVALAHPASTTASTAAPTRRLNAPTRLMPPRR